MLELFEHPFVLLAAAIGSLPALFPIIRWFFDDFDTFKSESGLEYDHNRALWLLGLPRTNWDFGFKLMGIAGGYGLLVLAMYQIACHVMY